MGKSISPLNSKRFYENKSPSMCKSLKKNKSNKAIQEKTTNELDHELDEIRAPKAKKKVKRFLKTTSPLIFSKL